MLVAVQASVVLGCVVAGLRLKPAHGLLLLIGVVVLLPSALQLPNGVTALPSATRLTALAVGAGLLRTRGRSAFAATPLHLAAGVFAGTALVTGVLVAPSGLSAGATTSAWLGLLDPLLVGLVALACAREAGPRAALRALAVVAVAAVLAGFVEHVTGKALSTLVTDTHGLESRSGQTRIRVGSDFALAYAWTVAALTPALILLLRRHVVGMALALGGCLAAEYWTFSRSVPLGVLVGLLVVMVGLRDRRLSAVLLVATLLVSAGVLSRPSLRERFTAAVDQGAVNVRLERAPVVLDAASHRPVAGLGLGGVAALGVGETDNSFLLTYAELGVPGLVTLLVLVGCGLLLCGRGLRGPPSAGRTTATAALAGAWVLVTAGAVFDAFAVRGTATLLGLLLAAGVAAAETVSGPVAIARPARDRPELRVLLVGLAVAGGMAIASLWPSHVVITAQFSTLSPSALTPNFDQVDMGRQLIATACAVATDAPPAGVQVRCVDSNQAAGVGALRLQAATTERVLAALPELVLRVRTRSPVHDIRAVPILPLWRGAPTAAATAPWSAGIIALLLALLVPSEPFRRLQSRPRRRSGSVNGGDLSSGRRRLLGPALRVGEQASQGGPEVLDSDDLQPLDAGALSP